MTVSIALLLDNMLYMVIVPIIPGDHDHDDVGADDDYDGNGLCVSNDGPKTASSSTASSPSKY